MIIALATPDASYRTRAFLTLPRTHSIHERSITANILGTDDDSLLRLTESTPRPWLFEDDDDFLCSTDGEASTWSSTSANKATSL